MERERERKKGGGPLSWRGGEGERKREVFLSYDWSGMAFQNGVHLPESEEVFLCQETNLTQGSVKDGTSMALWTRESQDKENQSHLFYMHMYPK